MPLAIALDTAIALFKRYRGLVLGIGMALALGILWLRGNHYRSDRDAWRSAFNAQKAAMIAAQAEAKAKAEAQRIATENRYAQIARSADNANVDSLRGAADRFGRMRTEKAGHSCSRSSPAAEGDPAPDRDGPGADAVLLTRPEYDQFVENSLRLERVRQWGDSLVREGLAIPEVEFGRE